MFEVEPEKYLTCPICQNILQDPVTLQCHHTYCRSCIGDFIKSRGDAKRKKIIPCALKCEATKVPDPQKPSEDWASQLKPSFMIADLVEDYLKSAYIPCGDTSRQCSRCSRNNIRAPAVKWCSMCGQSLCQTCISSHRRDPTTHLHTITDLPKTSEKQQQPFPQCEDHTDEIVKLICEDHKKAICNTCCSLHHRQCRSVVLMDVMGNQIIEKVTAENLKLQSQIEDVLTMIANQMLKYDLMVSRKKSQGKLITETFQKLIYYIKQNETLLLRELNEVTEKEITMLQDEIKLEENRLQLYQQRAHFIDQAVKSGSVFDMYRICQSLSTGEVPETDNTKQSVSVSKHVNYRVNSDELMTQFERLDFGKVQLEDESDSRSVSRSGSGSELRSVSRSEACFADLEISRGIKSQMTDKSEPLPYDSKACFAVFELSGTVKSRVPGDIDPILYGIEVVEVEGIQTIVVTDSNNKCVKSLYSRNNQQCYSRVVLDNLPRGITQLHDKVMVAVPHSRKIVTLTVTPDLQLRSTIHTSRKYNSLAVIEDTSLAAVGEGCVDILNMEGEVEKSISIHSNIALSSGPYYLCASNTGHLLLSDFGKKRVACLTREGQPVWVYTGSGEGKLRNPLEIITTKTGGILVVDRDSRKVIELSTSGEYIRDVLSSEHGLWRPLGICVHKDGSLFVCDDDVVKRFSIV